LQLFILVLVTLSVGDTSTFQQVIISRVETLRLLHDYYVRHLLHHVQEDTVSAGIVVDDDDVSSKHPIESKAVAVVAGGDDDLHELEDHIANRTVERLNQAEQQQQLTDEHQDSVRSDTGQESSSRLPPIIDNYYTRQLQQDRRKDKPFQFLIVGGSDGSG
jgi:hypothetical protein